MVYQMAVIFHFQSYCFLTISLFDAFNYIIFKLCLQSFILNRFFFSFFQANDVYLRRYSSTKSSPPKLGLSFPLTSNHFVNNNNRVELKCLASIARFYWKSAEVTLLQEKPKFASVMTSGDDLQVEKAGNLPD